MDKHRRPNLPSPKQILEDLTDPDVVDPEISKEICHDDDSFFQASCTYKNFKQLEGDVDLQEEIKINLDTLHLKLNENINNMKKQIMNEQQTKLKIK